MAAALFGRSNGSAAWREKREVCVLLHALGSADREVTSRPLRVTQIHCREGSDWHLVHRHADPLVRTFDLEEAAALARR
jgi:hypothetical protein